MSVLEINTHIRISPAYSSPQTGSLVPCRGLGGDRNWGMWCKSKNSNPTSENDDFFISKIFDRRIFLKVRLFCEEKNSASIGENPRSSIFLNREI